MQPILRRVSERRVDYLIHCFRAVGLAPDEARLRAVLAYAAYVGTLRLLREAPDRVPAGESAVALRRHFLTTLMPDEGAGCWVMGDRGLTAHQTEHMIYRVPERRSADR